MAHLVDEMTAPIKCPKCGHETEQSIARLKNDPEIICPSCGQKFKIESGGTTGKVADKLDEIDRLIDKIGKG
jgi:transposase-like protein